MWNLSVVEENTAHTGLQKETWSLWYQSVNSSISELNEEKDSLYFSHVSAEQDQRSYLHSPVYTHTNTRKEFSSTVDEQLQSMYRPMIMLKEAKSPESLRSDSEVCARFSSH